MLDPGEAQLVADSKTCLSRSDDNDGHVPIGGLRTCPWQRVTQSSIWSPFEQIPHPERGFRPAITVRALSKVLFNDISAVLNGSPNGQYLPLEKVCRSPKADPHTNRRADA